MIDTVSMPVVRNRRLPFCERPAAVEKANTMKGAAAPEVWLNDAKADDVWQKIC